MTFAIVAELPLGTYRGAGEDGSPEPMPSLARLHSALLCAAGFGPRAVSRGEELEPSEADEVALRWLEEHPPDGVRVPALTVNLPRAIAYRDDGTVKKTRTSMTIKKLAKHPDTAVSVSEPFVWLWREEPPAGVRDALMALCRDVGYLGTTESPVRLRASTVDVEATHELDPEADYFSAADVVRAPAAGRVAELRRAFQEERAGRPTVAADTYGTDEKSRSPVPARRRTAELRYTARQRASLDAPWAQAVVLPLDIEVAERDRVAWAVAAHRALVRIIGYGAPPMVTGVYPEGVRRPANRLALHLLPYRPETLSPDLVRGIGAPKQNPASLLAMLLPAEAYAPAEATNLDVLSRAIEALPSLRRGSEARATVVGGPVRVDAGRFWAEPEPGRPRVWRTLPAAVPDNRGARSNWTFSQAALLSLGFAWRDRLPKVPGRGDERARAMAIAASEAGAAVLDTYPLRVNDVHRYAHRVHEHAVIRPYRADVWLGDLASSTTIAAIGQSRHLGGGLLVPMEFFDQLAHGGPGRGARQ